MILYQCTECDRVASAREWNKATAKEYGEEIQFIPEDASDTTTMYKDCWYVCPHCHKDIDGEDIEAAGYAN